MKKKLLQLTAAVAMLVSGKVSANPYTNFTPASEGYVWSAVKYLTPEYYEAGDPKQFHLQVGASVEYGFDAEGRNGSEKVVDPYAIFEETQNLFPADLNTLGTSTINSLVGLTNTSLLQGGTLSQVLADAQMFSYAPKSTISETNLNLSARLALPTEIPGQLEIYAAIPIKFVNAKVDWTGVNPVSSPAQPIGNLAYMSNADTLALITGNQDQLEIRSFAENGQGDLLIMGSWKNHYNQTNNDALSSIGLYLQSGISFPTAKEHSVKNALAYPFGNDKAMGMPIAGMLNLNFAKNFRLGIAGNATWFFHEDSKRALAISKNEGSIITNSTFLAHRSPGTLISFNAIGEAYSEDKKYFGGVMYRYERKNADTFSSNDIGFLQPFADAMERYQERLLHEVSFRAGIDFKEASDSQFSPAISIAFKYPLKAQRRITYKTVTIDASINF